MSNARSDLNLSLDREREVIHDHWVLFLIQGIILAALGLLAIGAPESRKTRPALSASSCRDRVARLGSRSLVLQLCFLPSFIMGRSSSELVRPAPERPGDNEGLA